MGPPPLEDDRVRKDAWGNRGRPGTKTAEVGRPVDHRGAGRADVAKTLPDGRVHSHHVRRIRAVALPA